MLIDLGEAGDASKAVGTFTEMNKIIEINFAHETCVKAII